MAPPKKADDLAAGRQMYQALMLHFIENKTQADIAQELGISHATVNRLIKRGRQMGLVEIRIKSPIEGLVEIETRLVAVGGIQHAVVVPSISDNPDTVLQNVGAAAARLLLTMIADGDTICITGGKGVSAVVDGLQPTQQYAVNIIPATGLVQGKHYTDVNHVASLMADKLGGDSFQVHAPLFTDSTEQRDMLMNMRAVSEVFDRARSANLAVVGIGSILSDDSSYYDLHPGSSADRQTIEKSGATGELLAHLIGRDGLEADYSLNDQLVSLTLSEFSAIPRTIGVASGPSKVAPVLSAMRGNHLDTIVTDEQTALAVIDLAESDAS